MVAKNVGKPNAVPAEPMVTQNVLKSSDNSQLFQQESLRQAQMKAELDINNEQQLQRYLHETRMALEKEIHRQLVEQLSQRASSKSVTPDQQALIEKLYLDLKLINPELAMATLKASAEEEGVEVGRLHQPTLRTSDGTKTQYITPEMIRQSQAAYNQQQLQAQAREAPYAGDAHKSSSSRSSKHSSGHKSSKSSSRK